jgi:hypothetical protein
MSSKKRTVKEIQPAASAESVIANEISFAIELDNDEVKAKKSGYIRHVNIFSN